MRDWIDCRIELPPKDGTYAVSNHITPPEDPLSIVVAAEYDGFGFKYNGHYINTRWWFKVRPAVKRYGKIIGDKEAEG